MCLLYCHIAKMTILNTVEPNYTKYQKISIKTSKTERKMLVEYWCFCTDCH